MSSEELYDAMMMVGDIDIDDAVDNGIGNGYIQ